MTHQPLWVIMYQLPERGKTRTEELVDGRKEKKIGGCGEKQITAQKEKY